MTCAEKANFASYPCSRSIWLYLHLALALAFVIPTADAARRIKYQDPAAKALHKRCVREGAMVQRHGCVRRGITEAEIGAQDSIALFRNLLIDFSNRQLVADIGGEVFLTEWEAPTIRINQVLDRREFSLYTGMNLPDEPTAALSRKAKSNEKLVGRSYAETMKPHEKSTMRDVVVPQNADLSAIVLDAVRAGFDNAGFNTVVSKDTTEHETTVIDIEILRFWLWNHEGGGGYSGYGTTRFRGHVLLKITGLGEDGAQPLMVQAKARRRGSSSLKERAWKNTGNTLLQELKARISQVVVQIDEDKVIEPK